MSSTTQTMTTDAAPFVPTIADAKRIASRCLREGRSIPMVYIGRLVSAGIDLASLLTPAPKAAPATTKGDRQMTAEDFIPESVRSRRSSSDGRNVGTGLSRFSRSH